jgi:hypothetical protein
MHMVGIRPTHVYLQIFLLSIVLLTDSLSVGSSLRHENPFLYGLGLKEFLQCGPTEVYNRDNIFEYMDGEAEAYLPLGFTLLYTGRYRKPGTDKMILVEVYDMRSQVGAQGIFEVYTRKGGMEVKKIGSAAWTDNAIILFWRNRYFFRVRPDPTAETDAPPGLNDLTQLSRSIDRITAQIQQP